MFTAILSFSSRLFTLLQISKFSIIIITNLYPLIPLQSLAQAITTFGRCVELSQRGEIQYLNVDRYPVRSSETSRIQEIGVIQICEPLGMKRQPRLLLEGIGLGAATRMALQILLPRGRVMVAESVPEIIEWQRTYLEPLPKVNPPEHLRILPMSLSQCLQAHPESFDGIALELDYAIDPFLESSAKIADYFYPLTLLKQALREKGQVAIHSEAKDVPLIKALEEEGFVVEHRIEAPHKRSKSCRHHITFAQLSA
ncbi:MAG: spermidine synthase [Verrucomicrobiales bacterium]